MRFQKIIFFLAACSLVISCSVEKRHYRSGYHVAWKKNKKEAEIKTYSNPETVTASAEKGIKLLNADDLILNPGDSCDTIVFKNKMEMKAKVLEINQTEIKYKRCDNPDGPTYTVEKQNVAVIKYKNGIHEKIGSDDAISQQARREPINLADSCALIVTNDSTLIKGRIIEIRPDVIKYKYCDSKMKNVYVIKRSFVSKILVANGTIDALKEINTNNNTNNTIQNVRPRTHGSSVASMILGIMSAVCCLIFLPSLLFSGGTSSALIPAVVIYAVPAILAIVFGLKAYRKINEEPGRHKGMKMAQAGMIMGGIYILLAIIAIFSFLLK